MATTLSRSQAIATKGNTTYPPSHAGNEWYGDDAGNDKKRQVEERATTPHPRQTRSTTSTPSKKQPTCSKLNIKFYACMSEITPSSFPPHIHTHTHTHIPHTRTHTHMHTHEHAHTHMHTPLHTCTITGIPDDSLSRAVFISWETWLLLPSWIEKGKNRGEGQGNELFPHLSFFVFC